LKAARVAELVVDASAALVGLLVLYKKELWNEAPLKEWAVQVQAETRLRHVEQGFQTMQVYNHGMLREACVLTRPVSDERDVCVVSQRRWPKVG
jgi:hypothetical protein